MCDRNPITYERGRLVSEIDNLTILYNPTNKAQAKAALRLMTAHNATLVAMQDPILPFNTRTESRQRLYQHWYPN